MAETFVALDVETANADLASICQIGVVTFSDGVITGSWQSLINPKDYFDPTNVSIHGIDSSSVIGAPTFIEVRPHLGELLENKVVVSHTAFDRTAFSQVHEKYGLPLVACQWLDTARVSRRAWPQFARGGYGLAKVAEHCGIKFRHHDALEDARAAGEILLRAMSEHGLGISDWLDRSNYPISSHGPCSHSREKREGNPNGPLFGESVVFTGSLSLLRAEAADLAAAAGCDVGVAVNKTTTMLVVGNEDIRKLAGHEKSSKHRKAEALIMEGQAISILCERDFLALLRVIS